MSTSLNMTADQELRARLDRVQTRAMVMGCVGLALCLAAWFLWPVHFFAPYLVGYLFWLGIALGCIGFTMLHHLTGGSWGLVVRRPLEAGALTVIPLALLFLPIAFGIPALYPWAGAGAIGTETTLENSMYLNQSFFLIRAAFYFSVWIVMALLVSGWSSRQDLTADFGPSRRLQQLSAPGTIILFLTGTFSAVDWVMSLEPRWVSTIYGAMLITGDAMATLALMIVVSARLAAARPMSEIATPGRLNDLGNLLLAFVMLWAYMSFCQFLIIWAGNLTEEIPWYLRRTRGGWEWVALALIVFQFFLPFVVLLFRETKRHPGYLLRVTLWILVMRWVDLTWLVIPATADPASPRIPWVELPVSVVATVGVGGIWTAFFIDRLKRRPLVPLHDPNLIEARARGRLMNVEDYLPQGRPTAETKPGHEADVLLVRNLVLFATALVVVIILVEAVLGLVMNGFSHEEQHLRSLAPPRFADDSGPLIGPVLQPRPSADLAKLKEEEQRQLNNYGWVDRKAGVAHIPIARAIDILARSGLPSPGAAPAERAATSAGEPAATTKKKPAPQSTRERKP